MKTGMYLVQQGSQLGFKKKIKIILFLLVIAAVFTPFLFKKGGGCKIPIRFSSQGIALIDVKIEGHLYCFEFDMGSASWLNVKREVLEKIKEKTKTGIVQSQDVKGTRYNLNQFVVKKVEIGPVTIANVPVKEESENFLLQGATISISEMNEQKKSELLTTGGRVGALFLRSNKYWFLNFPKQELVVIRDFKKIQFPKERFIEVSIESMHPHIVISAETDLGIKRFTLDSGANVSVLRVPAGSIYQNHQKLITNRFTLSGHELGKREFYLYEISSDLDFMDGVLGMDFLMCHGIYLDFEKSKAYIESCPPSKIPFSRLM